MSAQDSQQSCMNQTLVPCNNPSRCLKEWQKTLINDKHSQLRNEKHSKLGSRASPVTYDSSIKIIPM